MIKTSLLAQVWFLIAMLIGQFAIIAGANAPTVLAGLIATKSLVILIDLFRSKKKPDSI